MKKIKITDYRLPSTAKKKNAVVRSQWTVSKKGFSLFEILIVVVIFAVIVFIADQSFISSLKSGTKSDLQQRVKSNANYVFSVMERQLHSARSVTACSGLNGNTDSTRIDYKDTNNIAQSFSFTSGTNGTFISSALGQLTSPDITIITPGSAITCSTTNGVTTVSVNLSLRQAGATVGLRPEEQDTFQTQTQITLRNN